MTTNIYLTYYSWISPVTITIRHDLKIPVLFDNLLSFTIAANEMFRDGLPKDLLALHILKMYHDGWIINYQPDVPVQNLHLHGLC